MMMMFDFSFLAGRRWLFLCEGWLFGLVLLLRVKAFHSWSNNIFCFWNDRSIDPNTAASAFFPSKGSPGGRVPADEYQKHPSSSVAERRSMTQPPPESQNDKGAQE
jgi:hypothetical protein